MLPIRFEYLTDYYPQERVYVSLLDRYKHHYTGETIYRVREEGESGWVTVNYYQEKILQLILKRKVEDTND